MKVYLGDGVYCEFNGYDFTLTTENGIAVTNTIVLDLNILQSLNEFVSRFRGS